MEASHHCSRCKRGVDQVAFGKNTKLKSGLQSWCNKCKNLHRERRKKNGLCPHCGAKSGVNTVLCESCLEKDRGKHRYAKRYRRRKECGLCPQCGLQRESSAALCNKCHESGRVWQSKLRKTEKHREYRRQYYRNRASTDVSFKLAYNLRNRLGEIISGKTKSGSAVKDLGCTPAEFVKYIEDRFLDGMSWKNYGSGIDRWNIDHIIPLASANLENRTEFLLISHYTNLRPMWQVDNIRRMFYDDVEEKYEVKPH